MAETLPYPELETKETLNVWVLDAGGRGHALGYKLAQAERIGNIVFSPGNGGTEDIGENCAVDFDDSQEIGEFCGEYDIDLAVVGMDRLLANGVVGVIRSHGVAAFGPTQQQARIESDRSYAKDIMKYAGIPTAKYEVFDEYTAAQEHCDSRQLPYVVKANGLADGKGVTICRERGDVNRVLREMMLLDRFGASGDRVIVEEFLVGQEISEHDICSQGIYKTFISAQDHKQLGDGDTGPMTGGMGTIAPVPWFDASQISEAARSSVEPLLDATSFEGLLFTGHMVTTEGPKVVEYNARFGDPETQVFMQRMKSDLLEHLVAAVNGHLYTERIDWHEGYSVCVVAASEGYPDPVMPGQKITGLDSTNEDVTIFHAGTTKQGDEYYSTAGRVLGVTGSGPSIDIARDRAYAVIERLRFDEKKPIFRTDIGKRPSPF